jgi:hypothetical protein
LISGLAGFEKWMMSGRSSNAGTDYKDNGYPTGRFLKLMTIFDYKLCGLG